MLVNKFKEYCADLGWAFNYGNLNWQNLQDLEMEGAEPSDLTNFLLLYKDRIKAFTDFNVVASETFSGEFILCRRSEISEKDYNWKYSERISKLEADADLLQALISDCDNLFVEGWQEGEVSDILDTNMDGIKIAFRIRHELLTK